uniref:RING-type domain-containing protein n=1 Tax=Psilocybe cubensis TaxID=181762 RepID=A0A8H7XUZ6_PSICU
MPPIPPNKKPPILNSKLFSLTPLQHTSMGPAPDTFLSLYHPAVHTANGRMHHSGGTRQPTPSCSGIRWKQAILQEFAALSCVICLQSFVASEKQPVALPCRHVFCIGCISRWTEQQDEDRGYYECPNRCSINAMNHGIPHSDAKNYRQPEADEVLVGHYVPLFVNFSSEADKNQAFLSKIARLEAALEESKSLNKQLRVDNSVLEGSVRRGAAVVETMVSGMKALEAQLEELKQEKGQLESQLQEVATLAMAFIEQHNQSNSSSLHTTVQERQIVDTASTDVSPTTPVEPLEDEISVAVAEALEPTVPSAKLRRDAAAAIYDGLRHRQAAVEGGKENVAPVASTSRLPPASCRPPLTSGTYLCCNFDHTTTRGIRRGDIHCNFQCARALNPIG